MLSTILSLCISKHGSSVIVKIIEYKQEYTFLNSLAHLTAQNINKIPYNILVSLVRTFPENSELNSAILNSHNVSFKNFIVRLALNKTSKGKYTALTKPHPTFQHLTNNYDSAHYFFKSHPSFLDDQKLQAMVEKIINLQEQFNAQGYVTFIHGQRIGNYLPEIWFTKLWEHFYKRSTQDFLFAHVKPLDYSATPKEKKLRKKIKKRGRFNEKSRHHLLFMNLPFFGNMTNPGSSTADYIYTNSNVQPLKVTVKDVFTLFGYDSYYEKFKKKSRHSKLNYEN